MRIAGFQKCSMVDFPGRVSAVVFTPGCNMNCHYCHNQILLGKAADCELLPVGEVLEFLKRRRRMLDGLVVSGGEPTLQRGLFAFLERIRPLGLEIKLDTNGTRPGTLARLLDRELVDFVAMDLKAPRARYDEICGVKVDMGAIEESIGILLESGVDHEFRTTFSPLLSGADVLHMARQVRGASRLVLQQYRRPGGGPGHAGAVQEYSPHSPDELRQVARQVSAAVVPCFTRGL